MGRFRELKKDKLYMRLRATLDVYPCPTKADGWYEKVYDWIENFRLYAADHWDYLIYDLKSPHIKVGYSEMVINYSNGLSYTNPRSSKEWKEYMNWLEIKTDGKDEHFERTMRKVANVFKKRHPAWNFSCKGELDDEPFENNSLTVIDGVVWVFTV